jgi:hypothetical protein
MRTQSAEVSEIVKMTTDGVDRFLNNKQRRRSRLGLDPIEGRRKQADGPRHRLRPRGVSPPRRLVV